MKTFAGSRTQPSVRRWTAVAAGLALAGALAACSPIVSRHGYSPRPGELERVQVGVDTRETVSQHLGRPSTIGAFRDDVWYFVSMRREALAFFEPTITEQRVVAIHFDEGGRVSEIGDYGLEDGRVIDLVTRETPTSGRQLTILQQLFENIGKPPIGGIAPR